MGQIKKWLVPLIALTFLVFTASASADNSENWGPALSTELPADLMVTTTNGEAINVHDLVGKKGLALAFVRSADWCRFCKGQLIDLNKRQADFAARGINLVALSYDSVETLKAFSEEFSIDYDLVSDPKSKVIDAFGIRNHDYQPESSGYGVPHPGVMVFDNHCVLVAKFAEESYRTRPDIDTMLREADAVLAN